MRYLPTLLAVLLALPVAASAQDIKGDQEVRRFIAEYEKAVTSRDIAFLERVMPEDYVYSGPSGRLTTRAQALKYFQKQRDTPGFKSQSLDHPNIKVHVVGNIALVTNDWISVTSAMDSTNTAPTTYAGRHTGVFERRSGRWMVIAEHDSEQPYDDKWMVEGVARAGREYNEVTHRLKGGRSYDELERSADIAVLDRMLAEDYTHTSRDGEIFSKAQVLSSYKANQITLVSAEVIEQSVRTIGNGMAIETGRIRYVGANAGRPLDVTERYTTTWAFYDGRWQITANHTSSAK